MLTVMKRREGENCGGVPAVGVQNCGNFASISRPLSGISLLLRLAGGGSRIRTLSTASKDVLSDHVSVTYWDFVLQSSEPEKLEHAGGGKLPRLVSLIDSKRAAANTVKHSGPRQFCAAMHQQVTCDAKRN